MIKYPSLRIVRVTNKRSKAFKISLLLKLEYSLKA